MGGRRLPTRRAGADSVPRRSGGAGCPYRAPTIWVGVQGSDAKGVAVLHSQLPWFVGGPVLGLCVVAIRALLGERLGITGGYSAVVESVRAHRFAFDWRAFVLIGVIVGGLGYALIAGGPDF